jgi:hypothetical protein
MRRLSLMMIGVLCLTATAQSPGSPLDDKRLSVHTLVREDVFAGVLDGDMQRLAQGEKNIETLLERRPADKASLLVWKAGAIMYRAVRALEAGRGDEFETKYAQALELLAQGKKLGPNDPGVAAATGGMYVVLADRLPEKHRAAAWAQAYESYQALWKVQAKVVDKLPLHLRGELLGGLAQSAQRTGRSKELAEYLDKMVAVLPEDSRYAKIARAWQGDAKAAGRTSITCMSCHESGRLAARRAALEAK